jgi:hypothetical protein
MAHYSWVEGEMTQNQVVGLEQLQPFKTWSWVLGPEQQQQEAKWFVKAASDEMRGGDKEKDKKGAIMMYATSWAAAGSSAAGVATSWAAGSTSPCAASASSEAKGNARASVTRFFFFHPKKAS